MDIFKKIKQLPKIELHCHLSGSIRPKTMLEIAEKENIPVVTTQLEAFTKYIQVQPECRSLKEYLEKFDFTLSLMQKPQYLARITEELLEDMAMEHVKYIEIRFAPFFHMEGGMQFEETVESILEVLETSKKKYGILSKLLLICMRHHSPETSMRVVEKGKAYLGKGVVGIDLAGNEHDFPPEMHQKAFRLAKEYGFQRTVHAGETGIPQNIVTAVENLCAQRIGHGVHAFRNEEVFQYVKAHGVPLEMCITSNVLTNAVDSYGSHPIKSYLDQGIKVTVNTDNTVLSNTTLEKEYIKLVEKQGFTLEDFKKVILNGIDACFASNEEKEILKMLCLHQMEDI